MEDRMKKRNRIIAAGIVAALWGVTVALLKALLAPAIGAAVVSQAEASNASYFALAGMSAGASGVLLLVSLAFAVLIAVILRSK